MKYQNDFEYSLDVEANVVSLCVVCHKKLHHGIMEEKTSILKKLYDEHKSNLKKSGIDIIFKDLLAMYK